MSDQTENRPPAVRHVDPGSPVARRMGGELWAEIQHRYGFTAPDPFDPDAVAGPRGGFWVAFDGDEPVGSIALAPLEEARAELDMMYVVPSHRRRKVADGLLTALEDHALGTGTEEILLRAGGPQPEALAFYRAAGFEPIEPYGRWLGDETALCFRKALR